MTAVNPAERSLAEQLRTDTRALHTEVERAGVMRLLLRGQLGCTGYCVLLRNLHAIYAALEPALLRHAAHPLVAPVVFEALFRAAPVAADLTDLHGADWRTAIPLHAATGKYVARLHEIAANAPELLVAHAYLRYLGDLSGGQMLRRIVAASLQPAPGTGTCFYEFGSPAEVAGHLRAFRAGLDALPLPEGMQAAIVDEARDAFRLHRELFDGLAATPTGLGADAVRTHHP